MQEDIKAYYGKVLTQSADLKTDACCTDTSLPSFMKSTLAEIHDEVLSRYYGCGLVSPEQLEGCRILDLGCGSGRDCYALSKLVGPEGYVVGVDMTKEQLAVANRYIDYHTEKFGYPKPNVEFKQGYIEHLDELDLPEASFDIIVSNCVINLSADKAAVLAGAYRLLKPGGELYFSDVYADRRVPQHFLTDPVLVGECLAGALYWNDFHNLAKQAGFLDPRLVEDRPLTLGHADIEERLGHIQFFSATYRLFKLPELESLCEDYGQAVIYQGTVAHHPRGLNLDKHHWIETGKVFPVCGNTYRMLHDSRFRAHFEFIGNWDTHYGIFADCGTLMPFDQSTLGQASSACC